MLLRFLLRFPVRIVLLFAGSFLLHGCDFSRRGHETPDSLTVTGQNFDMLRDPLKFTLNGELKAKTIDVFGKQFPLKDLLTSFYIPDTYTDSNSSGTNDSLDYLITGAQLIEGSFLSDSGVCEQRTMLLCTRGDFVEEEYYDLFFLARDGSADVVVSGKEVFEGSRGANLTQLEIGELPLPANRECTVLMVSSKTENGDTDLHKESWMEVFLANGKGFRSLFRLQVEETSIDEFIAAEDESQRSVSKVQRYRILDTSSDGLHDIEVTYTVTENGVLVREGTDVYRFDGLYYRRR